MTDIQTFDGIMIREDLTLKTLSDVIIASNNILDFRYGEGKLPAELNNCKFYFGESVRNRSSAQNVWIHVDKTDNDFTGIYLKWIYSNGTTSSAITSFDRQATLPANAVGVLFGAYGNATASPVNNVCVAFYKSIVDNDLYSEEISNWYYDRPPFDAMVTDFEHETVAESSAGLMTKELVVWGSGYPQYYEYFDVSVEPGEYYIIKGVHYATGYKPYILCHDDRPTYFIQSDPSTDTVYEGVIKIPNGINRLIVNGKKELTSAFVGKITGYRSNRWAGKKIVWFGTSIPAGVINAGDSGGVNSYPVQIGDMLGAKVYNEAVGSSCVRSGSYQHITSNDPMGYAGLDARSLLLSLSLSSVEKQAIFDEWNSKWAAILPNADQVNLTDAWKTNYKNTSWDIKLAKYLTGGSVGQVDAYVFDCGYNDSVVTYGYTDLDDEPQNSTDRTYYFGAMNFLIKKILEDNPKALIIFIGHYRKGIDAFGRGANFANTYVCEAQEKYANNWAFPLIKTWEKLGISMNTINVGGTEMTVLQSWFPDRLHPSSDTTGEALKHYANTLYPLFKDINW